MGMTLLERLTAYESRGRKKFLVPNNPHFPLPNSSLAQVLGHCPTGLALPTIVSRLSTICPTRASLPTIVCRLSIFCSTRALLPTIVVWPTPLDCPTQASLPTIVVWPTQLDCPTRGPRAHHRCFVTQLPVCPTILGSQDRNFLRPRKIYSPLLRLQ